MKNKLLPLFVVLGLGSFSAYSQVGIGTNNPDPSAQLHVVAGNRGVLIPNVKLNSTTDNVLPINNPAESLLVFNTATAADVTPGYYYWLKGKWNRMALAGESSGNASIPTVSGVPGTDGVSIPSGANMVIDNTGTIYVLKPEGDPTKVGDWSPINGKDGKDGISGAPGLAGGKGIPGASGVDGVTPADGITTWIDSSTGIIYVQDPITKEWKEVSGLNGLDGKNGKDGLAGAAGVPGAPGTPAIDANTVMYIDNTTGIIYVRDTNNPDKWVPINGKDGKDGISGAPGLAGGKGIPGVSGVDGVTPADGITTWIDSSTGIIYVQDPITKEWKEVSGLNGLDGKNGKDGLAGAAGVPGAPGTPAIDANTVMYIDNTTGIIYVRDTNNPDKWVPINGKDGKDGISGAPGLAGGKGIPGVSGVDGVTPADGITTWIDSSTGIIYVQDPITKEWKEVSGLNGLDGKNGKDGLAGAAGVPGAPGTPAIDANTVMYIDNTTGIIYVRDTNDPTKWIPINGKDGKDGISGAPGLAGGKGIPGASGVDGVTPADGLTTWINTDTGIVYVKVPSDPSGWKEVSAINGLDGKDGKDGFVGGNGVPGKDGEKGIDANTVMYVDGATGIIYVRDTNDPTKWIPINGKDGKDGISGAPGLAGGKGIPGASGVDGVTPADGITTWINTDTGIVYVKDPSDPSGWKEVSAINGLDGKDGKDGFVGGNGVPGKDGEKGIDANTVMYVDGATGIIYVRDTNDPTKWIPINGKDGKDGISGAPGLAGGKG
ncbi:hypothetical protein CLU81_0331 [Flavobacterium sp. 9]|uniref:hypothetical protein n=1 Tax=Flavobacterium sp. 9 TaxID=2035198 RepID=UPI000C1A2CEC|nr:hypothetical protein [Flavobacterium sp. 9]PIF29946.1 hypothetical protein CLU81_0331 [Flavobacterium sp. 9]